MSRRRAYGSGSIRIETRANGRQVYCGQFSVDGVQYERVLGEVRRPHSDRGLTKRDAERVMREKRAAVESGEDIGRRGKREAETQQAANERTLRQVADEHLRLLEGKGRKANTIDGYVEIVRGTLDPWFGKTPVAQITHQQVQAFVDHFRELPPIREGMPKGRSNGTILNHLNLLHAILATAVRRGYASENPVDRIDNRPAVDPVSDEINYLLMDEVDAVIRALPDDHLRMTMEGLILTAATTGLRQGELRALRWRNSRRRAARLVCAWCAFTICATPTAR